MSTYKPSLPEKICGEYFPFVIWGFSAFVVKWMFLGDFVKGAI